MGCYIWYSEDWGLQLARTPRLLTVPNVTAHPSTASVPITVLLYNGPLLCGFNVAIKWLLPKYCIIVGIQSSWLCCILNVVITVGQLSRTRYGATFFRIFCLRPKIRLQKFLFFSLCGRSFFSVVRKPHGLCVFCIAINYVFFGNSEQP